MQPETEADDGTRTRDPELGKLVLYQLSYVRAALKSRSAAKRSPPCFLAA